MAEYLKYKGARYKKVDEQCERVDNLERRFKIVAQKIHDLLKKEPKLSLNGNGIRYRMFGVKKEKVAFVCDNMTYIEDEKDNWQALSTRISSKIRSILRNEHITPHVVRIFPKNDGKFKFVTSGKIRKI